MKRINFLVSAILTFTIMGCEKSIIENTKNNPATDFQLKLTRTTSTGVVTQQIENALNQPGSAEASAVYFEKATNVHLKIGGIQTTTVVPRLFADIRFKFTSKVSDVAGVYHFPEDNNRVSFSLSETVNGNTSAVGGPASGDLTVTYDTLTKSLSGTITNIRYAYILDQTYASEVLSGKFSNVGISK
jgi:hypothetical protein